ncbi:acyltransferase family protein [Terriglobus tenax]|uniref:acyltransferase family protein n=1 Tax=Terriglobus tenax TaxID=1111115 RepID=UPI0021DF896F|nr:acyltransferase [Terriglobus tenax]
MTETLLKPVAEASAAAPRSARKPLLPALTGVRTFLAANIMFFHFTPPHIDWIVPIVGHGFVFVGFFLLISGFILSYNYADRIRAVKLKDFYLARVARLYPVYLVSLVVSIPILITEFHVRSRVEFVEGAIMTPLLLQGWSPWLATFWNTVAWTLSTEAFLYAIFPFMMRLRWPVKPARLVALGLGIWALGLVPHVIYMLTNPDGLPTIDRYSYGYYLRGLKFTPLPYVCTFTAGIVLGRLQAVTEMSQRLRAVLAFVAVGGVLGFLYLLADHTPYVLMHGGLLTPLFAMLVLGVTGKNPVSAFFGWKPFVVIGESTLCIYLLHFNMLQMLRDYHVAERLHFAALDPWASYVLVVGFAYLLYRFYENPARKWVLATFGTKRA